MTLVTCPSCGTEASAQARLCPKCGYHLIKKSRPAGPPSGRKALLYAALVAAAALGILALLSLG